MSKIWHCKIDDPIFSTISSSQWLVYAEMIMHEKKREFEVDLAKTEYLASFWNSEAVKKIQQVRENSKKHNFQDDELFEQSVLSESYKNNPLIKAIQQIRKQNISEDSLTKKEEKNLSDISKLMNKF